MSKLQVSGLFSTQWWGTDTLSEPRVGMSVDAGAGGFTAGLEFLHFSSP